MFDLRPNHIARIKVFVFNNLPPPSSLKSTFDDRKIIAFSHIDFVGVESAWNMNHLVIGNVHFIEKIDIIKPFDIFVFDQGEFGWLIFFRRQLHFLSL